MSRRKRLRAYIKREEIDYFGQSAIEETHAFEEWRSFEELCRRDAMLNPVALLHRENGPASIVTDKATGKVLYRAYVRNGKYDRSDAPAEVGMTPDGVEQWECYWHDGLRHRDGGRPCKLVWNKASGVITSEEYWEHGVFHRTGGPAYVIRDAITGIAVFEQHFQNGVLHRDGGPAHVERCASTGIALREYYHRNGKPYREGGGPEAINRDPVTYKLTMCVENGIPTWPSDRAGRDASRKPRKHGKGSPGVVL